MDASESEFHVQAVLQSGFVDHTQNDSTSPNRFVTKRFDLPLLDGLRIRDEALASNGSHRWET